MMKKVLAVAVLGVSVVSANALEVGGLNIKPSLEIGYSQMKFDATYQDPSVSLSGGGKPKGIAYRLGVELEKSGAFTGIKYYYLKDTANTTYTATGSINTTVSYDTEFKNTDFKLYAGKSFAFGNVSVAPYGLYRYASYTRDEKISPPYEYKIKLSDLGIGGKVSVSSNTGITSYALLEVSKTLGASWEVNGSSVGSTDKKINYYIEGGVGYKVKNINTKLSLFYKQDKLGGVNGNATAEQKYKTFGTMIGLEF